MAALPLSLLGSYSAALNPRLPDGGCLSDSAIEDFGARSCSKVWSSFFTPLLVNFLSPGTPTPNDLPTAVLSGAFGPEKNSTKEPSGFKRLFAQSAYSAQNPLGYSLSSPVVNWTTLPFDTEVESGRQPGYGKRIQLIPDGLNDPRAHLDQAMKLVHPFESITSLKEDHKIALSKAKRIEEECNRSRLETLYQWKELAQSHSVRTLQVEHEKLASGTAKRLGRKPRTAFMELLQRMYDIEDKAVPKLCLTGMPIIGEALESPFFSEWGVPAAVTVAEFLQTTRRRRADAMSRVAYMAKLGGPDLSRAIYEKTRKEVKQGTMDGPWTVEEMENKYGRYFNTIPSFGLEQGVKEDGSKKYHRIDDHSAGMTNAAASRSA